VLDNGVGAETNPVDGMGEEHILTVAQGCALAIKRRCSKKQEDKGVDTMRLLRIFSSHIPYQYNPTMFSETWETRENPTGTQKY
jgi:hypothetical protein